MVFLMTLLGIPIRKSVGPYRSVELQLCQNLHYCEYVNFSREKVLSSLATLEPLCTLKQALDKLCNALQNNALLCP